MNLAEQNCTKCKYHARARQLINGEWKIHHICTIFIAEGGDALYLAEPEADLCECFTKKENIDA